MEVLVVNDGSKDTTPDVARNYKGDIIVKLLDLQPNRGLAGAMREGFREALKDMSDADILIALDADDSHNPALMNRMISQIREGSDVVIASRYRQGSRIVGLTKFREFLSSGAGYLFRIFTPIRGVRDYTCGYRAYRVELLRKAHAHYGDQFIQQQGFGCMAEILLKLRKFKPIIHEVPFILRYDLKQGSSKMKVMKTVRQTLGLIFSSKK
jgi:dolichol-phosphate mannosyltransferase